MKSQKKKYFTLFVVFALITLSSAALPELGFEAFSGYDGLGRGIMIALFITFPSGLLALLFLILWIMEVYKQKHRDI